MKHMTDHKQILLLVAMTILVTFFLAGIDAYLDGKLPGQQPEKFERVRLIPSDSTSFHLVEIYRPDDKFFRFFLYDSSGVELLDFVDRWRGKQYIGTVKTSDSTRAAIPRERVSELWEAVSMTYDQGVPFAFTP